MHLVRINAPQGRGADVAQTAFSSTSNKPRFFNWSRIAGGESQTKDAVDIEASTPRAKRFVDALLAADFYNPQDYTINIRQPRSIISRENLGELTRPLVVATNLT
jgi:hypothetical protein